MCGGSKAQLWFRWLGVAGIELRIKDEILLIDPFFTRPPMRRMWFGHVTPNHDLIAHKIEGCDYILVTHAHWDHVLDVPDVVRNTGAIALGSPNTCGLLAACGVPHQHIREIKSGGRLTLGNFGIEVLAAEHMSIPGFWPGRLPSDMQPPLRLRDYRMDVCVSFLIEVDGLRLLDWSSIQSAPAPPADILFVRLDGRQAYYETMLRAVRPRLVIPVHWDNLFRPVSKPIRPYLKPPRWEFPPLQRMDPTRFKDRIEEMVPEIKVLVPEIFRVYDILRAN